VTQNEDYLKLLSIFHYVVAAMAVLFALIPTIHLVLGVAMASGALRDPKDPFPLALLGWFFILFASIWILCGLTFAVCVFLAGRSLQARTRYMFCLVMGGLECMFMPFGTVLGVFTLILLLKDDVKALFGVRGQDA
jgi:hypothetical protein